MKKTKRAPKQGTHVVWPAGVEERYGINPVTRWRWERTGTSRPGTCSAAAAAAGNPKPSRLTRPHRSTKLHDQKKTRPVLQHGAR